MRNKDVLIIGVISTVVLAGGGGFWWLHSHEKTQLNDGAASINASDTPVSQQSSSGSSLGVTSGASATNLGQLGSSGQTGSQSTPGVGQPATNSNSASRSPVDPSTFAQYDKYKDSQSALFGDIQTGTGAAVDTNKQVAIVYKGWLTNGTLFDESRTGSDGKIQALSFTEGAHQVILGMEQALIGMKVGGARLLIIPPAVGYGAQAQGSIPANSVLVFEVQLVDVK